MDLSLKIYVIFLLVVSFSNTAQGQVSTYLAIVTICFASTLTYTPLTPGT